MSIVINYLRMQNYYFLFLRRYLEYGEHNGHLYGTHLDTIRDVIRRGKMCVLDCSPTALKILHNSAEFLPYVIFIAAPGMELLKTMYGGPQNMGSRNLTFDRQSSIRYEYQNEFKSFANESFFQLQI